MFAFGSDEDSLDTIKDTVDFCRRMKLDTVQFAILHPLPGSRLFHILDSENRIFTKNWSLYDGTNVVFEPKNIHPVDLQEMFFWAYSHLYTFQRHPIHFAVCRYMLNRYRNVNKKAMLALKRRFSK
jgi:radical SAM superfamily enzyme YgiQ (UPF0313 family)